MRKVKIKWILRVITSFCIFFIFFSCFDSIKNNALGNCKNGPSILEINSDKELPSNDIFHAEKIADNIVRINGMAGELMYLVEGTEKAALIDTGSGVGNLREYVEKITSKPIVVILTHGHVDHASGAADFDDVYMNHADDKVYAEQNNLSVRKEFIESQNKAGFLKLKESDYVKTRPASDYKALNQGDIFDLGGVTLEIYSAAGHTPGQIAILFKEQRILMLGDAANNFTFLFDKNSLGLSSYEKNMKDLLSKTEGKFDKVFLSHGTGDAQKEILAGVIQVSEDIKAGKVDDVPFEFLGQHAFIAKKIDENYNRVDGGIGNIVYNKEKIYQ